MKIYRRTWRFDAVHACVARPYFNWEGRKSNAGEGKYTRPGRDSRWLAGRRKNAMENKRDQSVPIDIYINTYTWRFLVGLRWIHLSAMIFVRPCAKSLREGLARARECVRCRVVDHRESTAAYIAATTNRSGNFLTSCGSAAREESRDPEPEPSWAIFASKCTRAIWYRGCTHCMRSLAVTCTMFSHSIYPFFLFFFFFCSLLFSPSIPNSLKLFMHLDCLPRIYSSLVR